MAELVIARRSGAVHDPDGNRIFIRAGRTVAEADHPLVLKYPKAFVPVSVTLRTDPSAPSANPSPDDNWDPARVRFTEDENGVNTIYAEADPETVEHADQFRRLAGALRERGALPDHPMTAEEVVDHLVAIVDDCQRPLTAPEPVEGDLGGDNREVRREWARANGFEVADKGRLPRAVEDAYAAAHPAG
jgi:hypothetical protein